MEQIAAFLHLVRDMRAAQKKAGKHKTIINIERQKALEQKVDERIKDFNLPAVPSSNQGEMFDDRM